MSAQANFYFHQGDRPLLLITILGSGSIAGQTFSFEAWANEAERTAGELPIYTSADVTIQDALNRLVAVGITPLESAALPPGGYPFRLRRTSPGEESTLLRGTMEVLP